MVLNKRSVRLFNFTSEAELVSAFTARISNDEQLKLLDKRVLTAVLVTRILLWKHNEWIGSCAKTEEWLNVNINDVDIEERAVFLLLSAMSRNIFRSWAVHLGRRLLGFESFKDSEQ
ncbi:3101_t:CDS:2, partial [Paraglomus brasilianum]